MTFTRHIRQSWRRYGLGLGALLVVILVVATVIELSEGDHTPTPPATPAATVTVPATETPPLTATPGGVAPTATIGLPMTGPETGAARLARPSEGEVGQAITVDLDLAWWPGELPATVRSFSPVPVDVSNCPDSRLELDVEMVAPMWATVEFDTGDFGNVLESRSGAVLTGTQQSSNFVSREIPGQFSWRLTPLRVAPDLPYRVVLAHDDGSGGIGNVVARWDCTVRTEADGLAAETTAPGAAVTENPTEAQDPLVSSPSSATSPWLIVGVVAGGIGGVAAVASSILWGFLPWLRRRNTPNVFLSYRRGDAAGWTGRIFDHLTRELGSEHVFQDIVDIEGGADWVDELHEKVEACDVLLALMGDRWVGPKPDGTRRIDETEDWVRLETARALAGSAVVIPVLVDGMRMSALGTLPEDLAPLRRRNSVEITAVNFEADMQRLIRAVRSSKRRKREVPS